MADTQDRNNKNNRSRELAEAFMLINTETTIADEVATLKRIASSEEYKASDRISAIRTIWEYALAKPKQDFGVAHTLEGIDVTEDEYQGLLKKIPNEPKQS